MLNNKQIKRKSPLCLLILSITLYTSTLSASGLIAQSMEEITPEKVTQSETTKTDRTLKWAAGFGTPYGILGYALEFHCLPALNIVGTFQPYQDNFWSAGTKLYLSHLKKPSIKKRWEIYLFPNTHKEGHAIYLGGEYQLFAHSSINIDFAIGYGATNLEGNLGVLLGINGNLLTF